MSQSSVTEEPFRYKHFHEGREVAGLAAASCTHPECKLVHIFIYFVDAPGERKELATFSLEVAEVFAGQIEQAIGQQNDKTPHLS